MSRVGKKKVAKKKVSKVAQKRAAKKVGKKKVAKKAGKKAGKKIAKKAGKKVAKKAGKKVAKKAGKKVAKKAGKKVAKKAGKKVAKKAGKKAAKKVAKKSAKKVAKKAGKKAAKKVGKKVAKKAGKKAAKKVATKKAGKKAAKKVATKKTGKKKSAEQPAKRRVARTRVSNKLDIPDFILDPIKTRLPILADGFSLELVRISNFEWGGGLEGLLRLRIDGKPKARQEACVALLRDEELSGADWDEVQAALDRWRARVMAMSAEQAENLGVEGLAPWAEVAPEELERRYAEYVANARPETPEQTEQRRRAALEQAYAEFPRLAEHVQSVWGLTLPRTLAVYHAFLLAIASLPRAVRDASDTHSGGILDRLQAKGWKLQLRPGVDERVHVRFRQDPPEMLSFAWGHSDGLHFGLWYDTADEAIAVVANYARDSAETWVVGDHPLSVCRSRWKYDPPPSGESGFAIRLFLEELEWFEAEQQRVAGNTSAELLRERPGLIGGPGSTPVAKLPADLERRYDAYRNHPETVHGWIADARAALERGEAEVALALGRELHWFDSDRYREPAGALLLAAYEALGRHAHAGILRAHLAHRDLPSVDVYQQPDDDDEDVDEDVAEEAEADELVEALD